MCLLRSWVLRAPRLASTQQKVCPSPEFPSPLFSCLAPSFCSSYIFSPGLLTGLWSPHPVLSPGTLRRSQACLSTWYLVPALPPLTRKPAPLFLLQP